MGLFDAFDKDKRRRSAIEKNTKRLQQVYGQAESRGKAIEALRQDGSDEAIYALLMRFTVRVEPGITDQEEKQWVLDILEEFGLRVVPVIRRFLLERDAVTWPLRALQRIQGDPAAAELVCDVLDRMATEYQREHTKKITLIKHLVELGVKNERIPETLVGFLDDMDGDTVIATLEALGALDETGRGREPVLEALKEKGPESARVRGEIFSLLARKGWDVKGYTPTVESMIEEPYFLTSEGVVKRRGAP